MITKADLQNELAPIKAELRVLKWMIGFSLAIGMTTLLMVIQH